MLTPEQIKEARKSLDTGERENSQSESDYLLAMWAKFYGEDALDTIEAKDATIAALQAERSALELEVMGLRMGLREARDLAAEKAVKVAELEDADALLSAVSVARAGLQNTVFVCDHELEKAPGSFYQRLHAEARAALSPAPQTPESRG